jgi:hypothetical protein
MYQHTTPGTMIGAISDIEDFALSAGFNVTKSAGTKLYVQTYTYPKPDNYFACHYNWSQATSGLGPSIAFNTEFGYTELAIKDPLSTQTYRLLFYTYGGDRYRRGILEETWYIDTCINDIPCAWLNSLPGVLHGLDMFAGTNSEGKLWLHIGFEDKPMVYVHMGLGSMEKLLNFTGGDYISAHFCNFEYAANMNYTFGYTLAYQCASVAAAANLHYGAGVYYAPDLDAENKAAGGDYRTWVSGVAGTILEPGHTSFSGFLAQGGVGYNSVGGGEISISNMPLPNPFSGTSPLFPIIVYANNAKDRLYSGACGYIPGVRLLNMKDFMPRDEISLGSETWMIFPQVAKLGIVADVWSSANNGYAVLKNG